MKNSNLSADGVFLLLSCIRAFTMIKVYVCRSKLYETCVAFAFLTRVLIQERRHTQMITVVLAAVEIE